MSATDVRMPRPEAVAIAKSFVDLLEGTYLELKVAGSLRRRLAMVHDVEIVAVPRIEIEQEETVGLFGSEYRQFDVDRLDERMNALLEAGTVEKRLDANGSPRWGQTLRYLMYRGARVDLFTPSAQRFGWILLLRTGPAAFSRQLVVPRAKVPGEARTITRTKDKRPGLLPPHIVPRDGFLTYRTSGERIETPDERSVFGLFGLPYAEPWERL